MKSRFLTCCGIALGAMLAAMPLLGSGAPLRAEAAASGDLDGNGQFNAADVRLLQNWLLTSRTQLSNWQAADFDGNRVLNAVDLTLMKREMPEEEPEPAYIHLKGNSISYEGSNISVSGKTATISASGAYYIDGSLDGGQIIVNVPDETVDTKTVKLYLSGVTMKNTDAPCIMVENAENTSVNLVENKENQLSDGTETPTAEEPGFAVLHSKDDLTIKGSGSLEINAGTQYGIHCNNDLKINGGTLTVNTESGDAVRGRTSVTIKDGTLNINTEGDGVKATKGNMTVTGGTINIKSGKDALQSETDMDLSGGEIRACGDRGVTALGSVTLGDCVLLATATEEPTTDLSNTGAINLTFTKEWSKNNPIAAVGGGSIIFDQNTLKKYRYATLYAPVLSGSYEIYAGGIQVLQNGQDTFRTGSSYTDVNNTDHAELLYGRLFDRDRVHKIEIEMSNWDQFFQASKNEEWYPCDIVIDGERYENVGMRSKGNSSQMFIAQSSSKKYSWRIKLDKYDKYQNYYGLTEFCMNNMYSDPSCMRDILCYDALSEIDGVGPHCAYTDMYVNGSLYSFYFLAEQPGTTLAERLATADGAVLYKATDKAGNNGGGWGFGGGGNSGYCSFTQNMALDNFDVKFGTDDSFEHIDAVKQAINSLTSSNYKFIENVIDVPSFLKGFAVNSVMCNYDSYNGTLAHNYYLMYNDGKCYFVGWDYNLSLGNFMNGADSVNSDVTTSLYQVTVDDRPLAKLLQVDEYYRMYVGYVKQIVNMYSNPEQAVAGYASLIRDHVKADPNSFFTFDKFEFNLTKSANGLQTNQGGGFGGMWGGFGGMWGGGGGGQPFSFGGESISIVDFINKRNEVVRQKIGF